MKDILNKANRLMNTANNTVWNARRTKENVDSLNRANQNAKQRKESEKALEWKCSCGNKNTSKFCAGCGKAKPACPKCGAAVTGSKFCPDCGTAMDSE
ncbi:MAG: hypothetical protein FWF94_02735 [Oscillospiraceae bacterium]|nr:hypothetical protein [Oscillospiraceae bacterium]